MIPASPIFLGGEEIYHPAIQEFLHKLYPEHSFQWVSTFQDEEIDTCIIIYLFSYGEETPSLFVQAIQEGKKLFHEQKISSNASLVLIFYCSLPVAFPERKLQREKEMSKKAAEEFLLQEGQKETICLVHEFGIAHLEDTLQAIKGKHIYVEARVI